MASSDTSADHPGLPGNCDPEIREIVDYWDSLRIEGRPPDRRQIDPADIVRMLPAIALLDVQREPYRFKFRLLGERMNEYHGQNYNGRWLDEILPNYAESPTASDLVIVVEKAELRYRRGGPLITYEKTFIDMERVFLPFTDGGERVDIVLAHTVFHVNA
jgi:hypothetical protein